LRSTASQDNPVAIKSFFTNVRVKRAPHTALETIQSALDAFAAQASMVRVEANENAYARTISLSARRSRECVHAVTHPVHVCHVHLDIATNVG
jgi:hypothetical protein